MQGPRHTDFYARLLSCHLTPIVPGYKIREHSLKKIPVILVVGKKEEAEESVTIRRLGSQNQEMKSLAQAIKDFKIEGRYPSVEYED